MNTITKRGILAEYFNEIKNECDECFTSDDFLIVGSWDFIRGLNGWLDEKYGQKLSVETGCELPKDDVFFDTWLDYLTDDKWGFADEWGMCDCCGKVIDLIGHSYSWIQDYWATDYGVICKECVKEDYSDDYLEYLENNYKHANTILSNAELENAGYKKITGELEYGYYGVNHNPKNVLNKNLRNNKHGKFIFNIQEHQLFCTIFDLWEKCEN